jgi:predicted nucleic acid-binding protein
MANKPLTCVIDANVALKLFLVQTDSDRADALFSFLGTDPHTRFYVPDFFYAECVAILANYARMKKHSPAQAKADIDNLQSLSLNVIPSAALAPSAIKLALDYRISGYDAIYVAVSARVAAPLITADEKLVRAMQGKPYQVQSLASFEISL